MFENPTRSQRALKYSELAHGGDWGYGNAEKQRKNCALKSQGSGRGLGELLLGGRCV